MKIPTCALAWATLFAHLALAPGAHAQTLDLNKTKAPSAVVVTDQVRAELIAHAPDGVTPGKPIWLGLQIAHKPEWHTYWKNSGDSGLPTTVEWKLPAGITAGDIAWPAPKRIPIGNLANYGFEGTVVLPVPLTVASGFSADKLQVELNAQWLVCRQECIPEEGRFVLTIPARGSSAGNAAGFAAAFAAAPVNHDAAARFTVTNSPAPGLMTISSSAMPASLNGKELALFAEAGGVIQTSANLVQKWVGNTWSATWPLDAQRSAGPALMPFVASAAGQPSVRIEAKIDGAWPALAAAPGVPAALDQALKANALKPVDMGGASSLTFTAALLGALLGGLILNLMPCVFPVLSIKLFSLAQHGGKSAQARKARYASGMAYTAGVVLSFVGLAGLLLALRAGGEAVGWGFQLQSPAVVAALAVLFTLMALNFAGLFEFGQFLPSGLASMTAKSPVVDSFLSGVLAVAIASPCTAPFMGASLGFAVGLPTVQALLVFAAMGLGLALPFILVALVPALANWLPRPGAWMETFRHVMAFPMLATVVWLVWVLGQQTGIDGASALLLILVLAAFLVWALARSGKSRWGFGAAAAVLLALALYTVGGKVLDMSALDAPSTATSPAAQPGKGTANWQAWVPGKPAQLVAAGQPVFVDFTAAWCVTCQYNKKTTLNNADLLREMATKNVALLRADWTRRDPAITAALGELGRSGVPVYVLYRPGAAPVVLSEVLDTAELRALIAKL